LHEYYRHTDIVEIASYAQTVNVIGAIKTSKTAASMATTGLVLQMYRNNFGTIPIETEKADGNLDVSAALTQDGKALTLAVVNPTEQECDLLLNFEGTQVSSNVKTWRIAHSDPMAYNEPGQEANVKIEEDLLSRSSSVRISPLSINIYRFEISE
jgi:alpha-N-arabinofuranosidase